MSNKHNIPILQKSDLFVYSKCYIMISLIGKQAKICIINLIQVCSCQIQNKNPIKNNNRKNSYAFCWACPYTLLRDQISTIQSVISYRSRNIDEIVLNNKESYTKLIKVRNLFRKNNTRLNKYQQWQQKQKMLSLTLHQMYQSKASFHLEILS